MSPEQPFQGYTSQASLDFEQYASNHRPIYDSLRIYAGVCLRRVPSMTDQTLGRNIKDQARIVVEDAMAGEPLRFPGWGDYIVIPADSARDWVGLGAAVGLGNWPQIGEAELGGIWREVALEQSHVSRGCYERRGDALHFDDGQHRSHGIDTAALHAHLADLDNQE